MELYSGATETINEGFSKTESTVLKLMSPNLRKGHELYMDNYYKSVKLSEKLLDCSTHATRTLRSNRKGNPKEVIKAKLKKGGHIWRRRGKVYVSKWKDKRDVLIITIRNHPNIVTIKNKFGKEAMKPQEVADYNERMSGIDRCDQMISTYSIPRKTIRWYQKVILYLINISIWNAFYLYRKFIKGDSRNYRFIQFRDELVRLLAQIPSTFQVKDLPIIHKNNNRLNHPTTVTNSEPNRPTSTTNSGPTVGHWPEKIPGQPSEKSKKKSIFLKCRQCTKPPLCPTCFEEYHENIEME